MSSRYPGAWVTDGGFNPLTAPTPSYTYGLWSWGQNNLGQLGLGNTTNYSSPTQVGNLTTWKTISTALQTLGVKTDGTLWAWGDNSYGQLGLGNTTNRSSPNQVGSLTNWSTAVANGYYASFAIKTDGTLWSWGIGTSGQLGLSNTYNYSSPKQVGALTNWAYVSGGVFNTFGIKTDGTLWAWGYSQGDYGQSGTGTAAFSVSSPVQVGALTNWLQISSAQYNTAAVKTDGTLWTWGKNNYGQLGLGDTTNRSSPNQVGSLTNWLQVSCIYNSILVVKTDGTLWGFGKNNTGQLGLGNTTNYSSPKQVGVLTNWASVSTGYEGGTVAIKTTGSLWSWGTNAAGQLGQGNTTNLSSPQQIGSLLSWSNISTVRNSVLALQF